MCAVKQNWTKYFNIQQFGVTVKICQCVHFLNISVVCQKASQSRLLL